MRAPAKVTAWWSGGACPSRLRAAPDQHFFDVITHGYGAMYSYAAVVPPKDRWSIVAYIRALQLSQNATLEDLSPEQRSGLVEEAPK